MDFFLAVRRSVGPYPSVRPGQGTHRAAPAHDIEGLIARDFEQIGPRVAGLGQQPRPERNSDQGGLHGVFGIIALPGQRAGVTNETRSSYVVEPAQGADPLLRQPFSTEPHAVGKIAGFVDVHESLDADQPLICLKKSHCQRKILSATANETTLHRAIIAIWLACEARDDPSSMTDRKALIKWVNGRIWISGWVAAGNRSDEKKMPESIHIGSMTTFINPETASTVFARLTTNRPRPENIVAPSTTRTATVPYEP